MAALGYKFYLLVLIVSLTSERILSALQDKYRLLMAGECVRFLFTSCEGSRKRTSEFNGSSQRVSNKNRKNEPTMK